MKLQRFLQDESGFILSAELVIIATVLVLGMIVGLSQVQNAVVTELNDVGHAIGSLNQSFFYSGFRAFKWGGWTKSSFAGSAFTDLRDACDWNCCAIACDTPLAEGATGCGFVGGGESASIASPACSQPVCSQSSCSPVECSAAACGPATSVPHTESRPLPQPRSETYESRRIPLESAPAGPLSAP